MDDLVLAVDIGTSSLKASLIDASGKVRANARSHFPQARRVPSHWLDAWFESIHILSMQLQNGTHDVHCATHKNPVRVAAISISGNGPTLVSVDRKGMADRLLLWNDRIPATSPETSGRSLFIPRLKAFREQNIDAWNNAQFVLSGPEYLLWFLTGNAVTVLPEARFIDAYWSPSSLADAGLDPEKLAPFVAPGAVVGKTGISKNVNGILPAGIPVIAGGPDFIVALIGTGTLEPGKACDRAGTSEGLNVCTSTALAHPKIRTLPSVIAGLWNAAYLLPETGAQFHDWRNSSGQAGKAYTDIMREILASRDNPGRILVEIIGKSVKDGVDALKEATGMNPVFSLSGGQARNDLWNKMKADMAGATFALTATPDGELMGDAILAFTTLKAYPSITEAARNMVRILKYYECDSVEHARYLERFAQQ